MRVESPDIDQRLFSTLDRLAETEWHANQLVAYYHEANQFRWALNGFLRSAKEITQILQMECQSIDGFVKWYRTPRDAVRSDPVIALLGKRRDIVVHQKSLLPNSEAFIGISEGRGVLKLGLGVPANPLADSDDEMIRYCRFSAAKGDLLQVFSDDEESLPAVQRTWRIDELPDEDIVALAFSSLEKLAGLVSDTDEWLTGSECKIEIERFEPRDVPVRMYSRERLREIVEELQSRDSE